MLVAVHSLRFPRGYCKDAIRPTGRIAFSKRPSHPLTEDTAMERNHWKLATIGIALTGVTALSTGLTTAWMLRPTTEAQAQAAGRDRASRDPVRRGGARDGVRRVQDEQRVRHDLRRRQRLQRGGAGGARGHGAGAGARDRRRPHPGLRRPVTPVAATNETGARFSRPLRFHAL